MAGSSLLSTPPLRRRLCKNVISWLHMFVRAFRSDFYRGSDFLRGFFFEGDGFFFVAVVAGAPTSIVFEPAGLCTSDRCIPVTETGS